ncbi:Putative ABC-type Na+ efflux pump, permease component [Croceitalea dokdonensis DOKDO 023]|uniref:Putative ABC-type Na+ efflux pump, permease component n=1 Tax=Croceitalea dokdonensis DOKDO 023 TaxID=1300341 RepID=A0A0P7AU45_9FLAO|nr:ABC transporter permease [Croceitalea dokdonensis]KPM31349.1 Putative ABC-type Na+ efflux pump, permease component [Croceitalea dokdonensis DOKDO 023]
MRDLLIIVKKELTELLRDKKTIINSIVLPTLLIPILMFGGFKVSKMIQESNQQKTIKIGLLNAPEDFKQLVAKDTLHEVTIFEENQDFKSLINSGDIQTALVFSSDWSTKMDSLETSEVLVHRNGTKDNINSRVSKLLDAYSDKLKTNRIATLNIPVEKMNPMVQTFVEVSEQKELIGKRIGGFIPYIFILTMWGGCLLAAIDLVTGEKERKTIETTLSLPVSKFSVLMGKAIVASILGFVPALLNLIGLIVGLNFIEGIPDNFKMALTEMLNPQSIVMILLLLIPFSLFLSGLIIALVAGATSFKEAQSKASPIIILIIIPLVMALMPGIEFTWSTVFIPVLNIGLGVKEIMAGTVNIAMYIAMLVSLIAFAVAAIYFSYKKFSDESAILS